MYAYISLTHSKFLHTILASFILPPAIQARLPKTNLRWMSSQLPARMKFQCLIELICSYNLKRKKTSFRYDAMYQQWSYNTFRQSHHAKGMLTQQLKYCTTQQWLKEFYRSLAVCCWCVCSSVSLSLFSFFLLENLPLVPCFRTLTAVVLLIRHENIVIQL